MKRRFLVHAVAVSLGLAFAAPALAEPTATQKATAETLFQRGVELAEAGRVADACTQFDASLQIDPALGTLFRLADCYDRMGRTASAWALFSEAQARAKAAEQAGRERIAAERVANLELRLSKLSLSLGENASLAGLELRLNDVLVPSASWGLPLPVDPGPQRLRLSAPGRLEWVGTVTVEKGPSTRSFTLPALVEAKVAAKAEPKPPQTRAAPVDHAAPYPVWLGYAVSGVGLASAGIGGIFGYRAYDLNQRSLDECSSENANACTQQGHALRGDARKAGVASTAFVVAGGVLLATGVTLIVLRPTRREARVRAVRLSAHASPQAAFAGLTGEF